ncbi:MAG: uroporphyrinogen decarboxylase family protein [Victivallaceae bacterium]|nr:uroporphyrinogen decarboxylase family protein [Victivallaceae bacterium]
MMLMENAGRFSSKERVMLTFNKSVPDRVPINYLANSGIDRRFKAVLGLKPDDNLGLKKAIGVDFAGVQAGYTGVRLHSEIPGLHVDPLYGIRRKWIEHETGGYWDYCDFPLQDALIEEIEKWPLPSPDDFDYAAVPGACKKNQEFAVFAGGAGTGDIINSTGMLRGMEQVLVDLITEEPAGLRLIQRKADLQLEILFRTIEAAEGLIDFVWMGEDLGSQKAPLISTELYRRIIRPIHQRFIDVAKHFGLPVMIHTCGSSSWAYEDFIEMGIDAVDTLQPEAKDMAPEYLKEKFGGRLAFHGCVSTAGPVAYGTPDEVTEYCRHILEIMMPGGGYCFAPTHCLQDNSPAENVLAMYKAGAKYGWYE